MPRSRFLAGAIALAAPFVAAAAEPAPAPAAPQKAELAVVQMATVNPRAFVEEVRREGTEKRFTVQTTVARNQLIFSYVVLTGCKPAADGNCNVTTDWEIFDPAGAAYGSPHPGSATWNKPPRADNQLMLGETALGLKVEAGEALGAYLVRARTTDHVAGVTILTQQPLTVVEAPAPAAPAPAAKPARRPPQRRL